MKKEAWFKYYGYDPCAGDVYYDFVDYIFERTDFFMLVYVNYNGKGYSKKQKYYKKLLEPFKIKSRTNPTWPGTNGTFSLDGKTRYNVCFYRNHPDAKEILKSVSKLSDWSRYKHNPEDLAFFKGDLCRFWSIGHEEMAAFMQATDEDIEFMKSKDLFYSGGVKEHEDAYFDVHYANEELYSFSHKRIKDKEGNIHFQE